MSSPLSCYHSRHTVILVTIVFTITIVIPGREQFFLSTRLIYSYLLIFSVPSAIHCPELNSTLLQPPPDLLQCGFLPLRPESPG